MTENGRLTLSVLMVGCGDMGAATASAAVSRLPTISITAIDPDIERAPLLLPAQSPVSVIATFDELKDQRFDVCIVSVKPEHVESALEAARASLSDALVISIAAGIPLQRLRKAAPGLHCFVRVRPSLPALAASAMSVGFAEAGTVLDEDRAVVEEIFGAGGRFYWLNREDEIDLATGMPGSGPGNVFPFTEYLQRAAEQMGSPDDVAERFARQTVVGAARLLELNQRSVHDLKIAVTSPGGTTAAGLAILEDPGALPALLVETTAAAAGRAAQPQASNNKKPKKAIDPVTNLRG